MAKEKYTTESETTPEYEPVNDDRAEDMELEEEEAQGKDKQAALRKKLSQCEAEKMAHLEELQRTKAEFLNSKKRLDEQLAREKERVTETHIEELLPLADSFEIAMQHESWTECSEMWRKGVEGIHAQLQKLLSRYNVTAINQTGEPFDPHRHEAVTNEPVTDDAQVNTVIHIVQTGYERNGQIIRPAKVAVGSAS